LVNINDPGGEGSTEAWKAGERLDLTPALSSEERENHRLALGKLVRLDISGRSSAKPEACEGFSFSQGVLCENAKELAVRPGMEGS
jgi:hypothetical protein